MRERNILIKSNHRQWNWPSFMGGTFRSSMFPRKCPFIRNFLTVSVLLQSRSFSSATDECDTKCWHLATYPYFLGWSHWLRVLSGRNEESHTKPIVMHVPNSTGNAVIPNIKTCKCKLAFMGLPEWRSTYALSAFSRILPDSLNIEALLSFC